MRAVGRAGGVKRETIGRFITRAEGAAAGRPACGPSALLRFGSIPTRDSALALVNWFLGTDTAECPTDRPFTITSRETAVTPFGARKFA
jgi:hypothetical protein